ncbi:aminotransferase class III-fold pyridoxal phosphate-dependent enzyme [uncultured Marivita sp.]|uniref:aminotransferase class III-fold pyridoxal phosphate-dependent enzyme n=1 Tax=uncultured Marivita sp. TaxID=888080 RepID=UPI002638E975|nr:aminotransferase class III-fold pyridoxal phosphate-dependent enzyme [uncultured Marivita sp.]
MNGLNPTRARLLETFGLDLELAHGVGCELIDTAGRKYLDFLSQYGALPFGHNPSPIWHALHNQQNLLRPAMVQPLRAIEAERLADRLAEITPHDLGVVSLANSGAEAVEAAIKLARARSGRDLILSTHNGFHGKTMGALSATGKPMYQKDFGGPARNFEYVAFGDLQALEDKLVADGHKIAAFIVEPIQGEGGVVSPADDGYLDAVISLCRKHGVLSIVDEIQTGLGRTGQLFACDDCEEAPDMLLLGKALGGGLMPISAVVVRPEIWDDRFGFLHSSTFANNNLACAAANATLDLLMEDDCALIDEVARNGRYFQKQLEALKKRYPGVLNAVRGRGFMRGLEFHKPFERADSATMAFCGLNGGFIGLLSSYLLNIEGVLTAPVFNDAQVMRLQPPLIAGRAEIDRCVSALDSVCDVLDRGDYRALMQQFVMPENRARLAETVVPFAPQQGPARAVPKSEPGRFCFLIHYTQEEDLLRSDPSFAQFTPEERSTWMEWVKRVGPGFAWPVSGGTSLAGAKAEGMIMSVPLLPKDMVGKGRKEARTMIQASAGMAAEYGASRFGLGAFTSIVTNGGSAVSGRGVPVTSGNTLTTVSGVTALERAARRVGIDPAKAHVVVVGATGAIGRLASMMLARRANRLTLVGNAGNSRAQQFLDRVADEVVHTLSNEAQTPRAGGLSISVTDLIPPQGEELSKGVAKDFAQACVAKGQPVPIAATTDLKSALETADLVLVATSAEVTFLDPTQLRPGTVVCDVARPPNVAHADLSDKGVLVFDGGLVRPPFPVNLGPFQNLPEDLCWGCLGETMLLALEGETDDYSLGRDLSLVDADRISEMARRHGFEPAEPQWYGQMLDDADFERVAEALLARQKSETPPKRVANMWAAE